MPYGNWHYVSKLQILAGGGGGGEAYECKIHDDSCLSADSKDRIGTISIILIIMVFALIYDLLVRFIENHFPHQLRPAIDKVLPTHSGSSIDQQPSIPGGATPRLLGCQLPLPPPPPPP